VGAKSGRKERGVVAMGRKCEGGKCERTGNGDRLTTGRMPVGPACRRGRGLVGDAMDGYVVPCFGVDEFELGGWLRLGWTGSVTGFALAE
jgi:hypothetical protein